MQLAEMCLVMLPDLHPDKLWHLCRAPDTASIKSKMMYASTKEYFKGYLDGLSIELQASEPDELTEQDIADAVRSVITRS